MMLKNLGNLLQTTRQSKNFDLKQIATTLKIKEKYLRAVEEGEIVDIADKVYLYGCIKSYANWLGLNGDELAAQLKQSQKMQGANIAVAPSVRAWYLQLFLLSNSKIYIVSFVAVVVAYSILFHLRSSPAIVPLYHPVVREALLLERLASYEGKDLLLVAEKDVLLTISNDVGIVSHVRYLRKGEVFFITYHKSLQVTADHPEQVDVFLDNPGETFLGKMTEFFN